MERYETAADYNDVAASVIYRAQKSSAAVMRAQAAEELKAQYPMLEVGSGPVVAAKNLRKLLKAQFPDVKFSVTTSKFSGGNSMSVRWTDGPATKVIDSIAGRFKTGSFDGMEDLYRYEVNAWNDTFGDAKYINVSRSYSDEKIAAAIAKIAAEYAAENVPTVEDFNNGRTWNTSPLEGFGRRYCWQELIYAEMNDTRGE